MEKEVAAEDIGDVAGQYPPVAGPVKTVDFRGCPYNHGRRSFPSPDILRPVIAAVAVLAAAALWDRTFTVERPSEVMATIRARCAECSWSSAARPAAVLKLDVDGRASQDLILYRGAGPAEYRVVLGAFGAGPHRLRIRRDVSATPRAIGEVAVDDVQVQAVPEGGPEHRALAYAPRLHPRPNARGRFTDVPLVMWYETDETPRGTQIRYSVVFSNEDGGTPADRLMATWGRLTDIEYVLGIDFDRAGGVLGATYQGPDHKIIPYRGRLGPGRHPELWVVTDNNMVQDHGQTRPTYAPAPVPFDLRGTSREAVMDAHPWTYAVSSQEAMREGRVDESARPGSKKLPDPRRFLYLEACAETRDAALTFGVAVDGPEGRRWYDSDGGVTEYRIIRSATEFPNGCFRGAVAVPADTPADALRAVRFRAYTRKPREGEKPLARGSGSATVTRVNRLFRLGPDFVPGPDAFLWRGTLPLEADGAPGELAVPPGPIAR
jgi:hypothetical protein